MAEPRRRHPPDLRQRGLPHPWVCCGEGGRDRFICKFTLRLVCKPELSLHIGERKGDELPEHHRRRGVDQRPSLSQEVQGT